MYLQPVLLSPYSPAKGANVDVLDVGAVQQNFHSVAQHSEVVDETLRQVTDRLQRMEQFLDYCHRAHPEVLKEFLTVQHTKVRVGAVQSPPPLSLHDMDLHQLELRTLAAIGKLP